MNVEIEAEAALFPEKEYINGIFVAVWSRRGHPRVFLPTVSAPSLSTQGTLTHVLQVRR